MLTDLYKKSGIALTTAFGGPYPEYFLHPAAEYQALARFAGVLDLTHWKILRLVGRDRVSFLNAMLTNDIASLEDHQGCHSLITTIKGKILAELYVFVRPDDCLVFVAQGNGSETRTTLEKHIVTEDVTIEDLSHDYGVLALEGSAKSQEVIRRLLPKGPLPKEPLRAYPSEFGDTPLYVMANSVSGESGYHILVPAQSMENVRRYLVQASRGSDGLAVGRLAWNVRRIENGLPWYGIDFTGDNFPDEARLADTISYTKGCFRGQETLARLHHRGHVNRLLVGLTINEKDAPESTQILIDEFAREINIYDEAALAERSGPAVRALELVGTFPSGRELFAAGSDKPLGRVTSACFSPILRKPLMLGYLRHEVVQAKGRVRADDLELTIVDLPLAPR